MGPCQIKKLANQPKQKTKWNRSKMNKIKSTCFQRNVWWWHNITEMPINSPRNWYCISFKRSYNHSYQFMSTHTQLCRFNLSSQIYFNYSNVRVQHLNENNHKQMISFWRFTFFFSLRTIDLRKVFNVSSTKIRFLPDVANVLDIKFSFL